MYKSGENMNKNIELLNQYRSDVQFFRDKGACVSATIELTARCNFFCEMCYVNDNKTAPLSVEDWKGILAKLSKSGVRYILFTGGEILTYSGLYDLLDYSEYLGLKIRLKTNASLINEEFINYIDRHDVFMCDISLYGYNRESYIQATGTDSFDAVNNALAQLVHQDVIVRIVITNSGLNIKNAERIIKYANSFGCPIIINEGPLFARRDGLPNTTTTYSETRILVKEYSKNISHESAKKNDPADVNCKKHKIPYPKCSAGRSSCAVKWDGTISPCLNFPVKSPMSLTKVSFDKGWRFIQNEIDSTHRPKKCETCIARDMCNYCPAYDMNSVFNDFACNFWMEKFYDDCRMENE